MERGVLVAAEAGTEMGVDSFFKPVILTEKAIERTPGNYVSVSLRLAGVQFPA